MHKSGLRARHSLVVNIAIACRAGTTASQLEEQDVDEHEYERTALEMQDRILTMSDDEILAAYEASEAEAGDP